MALLGPVVLMQAARQRIVATALRIDEGLPGGIVTS
jgi:hypothetical protein